MPESELNNYKNVRKYVFSLILIFTVTLSFLVIFSIFSTYDQKYDATQLSIAGRQRSLLQRYHKQLLVSDRDYKISNKDIKTILQTSINVLINGGELSLTLEEEEEEDKSMDIALPKCSSNKVKPILIEQQKLLEELFLLAERFSPLDKIDPSYAVKRKEIHSLINDLNTNTNDVIELFAQNAESKNRRLILVSVGIAVLALSLIVLLLQQMYMINKDLIYENRERLKIERKLKEYSNKLAASNKELEHFAFVASHDLQEPLRQIISFGELIERKCKSNIDEKTSQYLKFMVDSAYRMRALIDDVLELSRVTMKERTLQEVDLNNLLKDVIDDFEGLIKEKHATIHVNKLPIVNADKGQIRQLFHNLISNSIKYSKPNESPVITVNGTLFDNNKAEISFSDNGVGFNQNDSERIFDLFQRLHTQDEFTGTGLGLAICKKIVERHGGSIKAEGIKGQGATFTLVLPRIK